MNPPPSHFVGNFSVRIVLIKGLWQKYRLTRKIGDLNRFFYSGAAESSDKKTPDVLL